jgi:hypothetical protein
MSQSSDRKKWPGPEYHVQVTFRAALSYAYAWCTDYSPGDAKLEGEKYDRKVIRRTRRQVTYEDLEDSPHGWYWMRYDVTLQPPNRWHMESIGTHVATIGDYLLTPLPNGGTRFEIWWRRRPGLIGFRKRSKADAERSGAIGWKRFARALDRDYRKSRARS